MIKYNKINPRFFNLNAFVFVITFITLLVYFMVANVRNTTITSLYIEFVILHFQGNHKK